MTDEPQEPVHGEIHHWANDYSDYYKSCGKELQRAIEASKGLECGILVGEDQSPRCMQIQTSPLVPYGVIVKFHSINNLMQYIARYN